MRSARFGLGLVIMAVVVGAATTTAVADDGNLMSGAPQSMVCTEVIFPANARNTVVRITGGTGEADLYVYPWNNGVPPTYVTPYAATCAPYKVGNEEVCDYQIPDGAGMWWGCVKGYSAGQGYSNIQMIGEYYADGAKATATGALSGATEHFIDYWGDNLFLGVAYHRIGCLSARLLDGSRKIVSDTDYDGFSDSDYCRRGQAWNSPTQYGASSHLRTDSLGPSFSLAQGYVDTCGGQANTRYNTPAYAKRSNSCTYNVLANCNSDCWIREFSSCVSSRAGNGRGALGILSPCM